jgi:hypothetical protein
MTAAAPPPEDPKFAWTQRAPNPRQCRQEVQLRDWQGMTIARYIWFCDGSAMKITPEVMPAGYPNGFYLSDWRGVAEDLLTYAVPRRVAGGALLHPTHVQGIGTDGQFYSTSLGPVIHARPLAGLLGADVQDVREVLAGITLITMAD